MSQIHQCNDGREVGTIIESDEQPSDDITIIEDSTPTTAGFGDNKMLIYLVAAGALLWYLNKEGYLKKILK